MSCGVWHVWCSCSKQICKRQSWLSPATVQMQRWQCYASQRHSRLTGQYCRSSSLSAGRRPTSATSPRSLTALQACGRVQAGMADWT